MVKVTSQPSRLQVYTLNSFALLSPCLCFNHMLPNVYFIQLSSHCMFKFVYKAVPSLSLDPRSFLIEERMKQAREQQTDDRGEPCENQVNDLLLSSITTAPHPETAHLYFSLSSDPLFSLSQGGVPKWKVAITQLSHLLSTGRDGTQSTSLCCTLQS